MILLLRTANDEIAHFTDIRAVIANRPEQYLYFFDTL